MPEDLHEGIEESENESLENEKKEDDDDEEDDDIDEPITLKLLFKSVLKVFGLSSIFFFNFKLNYNSKTDA